MIKERQMFGKKVFEVELQDFTSSLLIEAWEA